MTEEKTLAYIRRILEEVSQETYPEIHEIICMNTDPDMEMVYRSAYEIACQLHEADRAKLLPECVAEFMIAAFVEEIEAGSADAACDLGSLYYTGRGGEQSYEKAIKYYTLSAGGGCRQAQENLGYCYYYGRDVDVDYEKAFHYFAPGAFMGNIRSLYKIGDMYRSGHYVKQSGVEAFHIYRRCEALMTEEAEEDCGADVMMRVGDCFFEGIGTEINYRLAMGYYQIAERMFYDRLATGDFYIKSNYDKVIARQAEIRNRLEAQLPKYNWTE